MNHAKTYAVDPLLCMPYVAYGVQYIYSVSVALFEGGAASYGDDDAFERRKKSMSARNQAAGHHADEEETAGASP